MIRIKIIKEETESVGNKWMTWPLMWLNRSVVIINATLQLLYIYIYIYDNNNYDFDVKVKHCGVVGFVYDVINCECLGYIFCFRIKEKEKDTFYINFYSIIFL